MRKIKKLEKKESTHPKCGAEVPEVKGDRPTSPK